jgi:GTP cyclohydrolase II
MGVDKKIPPKPIVLTSHTRNAAGLPPVIWGAGDVRVRGPVLAGDKERRNALGTHSGVYGFYRALSVAAGHLSASHKPDLTDTTPAAKIGPFPQWAEPGRIVSLDPFGHVVADAFADLIAAGIDIRPTIAVTRAHIQMPEIMEELRAGRLVADGHVLQETGHARATKIAIEPVWYLPGIAERLGITEANLRRALFEESGGMFPELVTRGDLKVFLPPIGSSSVYIFGDTDKLGDPATKIACRMHDECNGSDVFGSDICTCRPYLAQGIDEAIRMAQQGGVGIIIYGRKEGRALGEVTKFLVYNARKRQQGGDRAEKYFERTECIAGVSDMRFQEFMPDILHWLGVRRIDRLISMSNMKYDSVVRQGIEVVERIPIPDHMIPADARVEMDAKMAAGYFTTTGAPKAEELALAKGRSLNE